jgi:hypothetical protein
MRAGMRHAASYKPLLLLNMTRELHELVSVEAGRRTLKPASDRWLVVIQLTRLFVACWSLHAGAMKMRRPDRW